MPGGLEHAAFEGLVAAQEAQFDAGMRLSQRFAQGKRRFIDWFDWILPEAWNYEHNILHHYPEDRYVAASLALFSRFDLAVDQETDQVALVAFPDNAFLPSLSGGETVEVRAWAQNPRKPYDTTMTYDASLGFYASEVFHIGELMPDLPADATPEEAARALLFIGADVTGEFDGYPVNQRFIYVLASEGFAEAPAVPAFTAFDDLGIAEQAVSETTSETQAHICREAHYYIYDQVEDEHLISIGCTAAAIQAAVEHDDGDVCAPVEAQCIEQAATTFVRPDISDTTAECEVDLANEAGSCDAPLWLVAACLEEQAQTTVILAEALHCEAPATILALLEYKGAACTLLDQECPDMFQ